MAADLKKAKKKALMELIKHVNKKRFQDKEIDPKAEMAAAMMKNKEDDDLVEEQEEKAPTKQDAETEADSDFDTYRKAYMTKSAKSKPSGSSMAVVGEGKKHFPLMMKKGGKKRG